MLNPNGNCLGVALSHCWQMTGMEIPDLDLESASSVADAIALLSAVREPRLVIRHGAGMVERFTLALNASRFRLQRIDAASVTDSVFLSLRTMRQLYGIPRLDGHWIAARIANGRTVVCDDLWATVAETYPDAHPIDPSKLLEQIGPTLLVGSK
jgi:hypothetical protein